MQMTKNTVEKNGHRNDFPRVIGRCGLCLLSVLVGVTVGLAGCATEFNPATQRQETLFYTTDKEMRLGDDVSRRLEKEYQLVTDPGIQDRLDGILRRLAPVTDRHDLVYVVRVLDDETVNAVSLPGGYVYLFKGLVEKTPSDDVLAAVLAHELGHINARHGLKRLQASYGLLLLQVAAAASQDADAAAGTSALTATLFHSYSQKDEFEADRLAVKYLKAAGYDPMAMVRALELLEEVARKEPLRPKSYWRTHPYLGERKAAARTAAKGELDFKDYLNLLHSSQEY